MDQAPRGLVVERQRLGVRPGRVVRAVALAIGATVTLSVAVAQLTRPAGGAPIPSARPATAAASPSARRSASPSIRPTPPPVYQVFGSPAPSGTVPIVLGSSYRDLDLATGALGTAVQAAWPSRVLVARSGSSLCLCVDEATDGGDATSTVWADGVRLATYQARPDRGWWSMQAGSPIVLSGSLAPDGRWVAIGSARLQGLAWHLRLDVYEVATGRPVTRQSLGTVSADDGQGAFGRVFVWPPIPSFSPDGRTIAVQATVVEGDTIAETRLWTTRRVGDGISRPVRIDPKRRRLLADPCLNIVIDPIDGGGLVGWCWFDSGNGQVVRVADASGDVVHQVPLADDGTTWGWGPRMVLPEANAVLAWDPAERRLARVDLRTGVLERSSASAETARAGGAVAVLAALTNWIAPTTHAKWILEPGLAISPDGSTIYAIGVRTQSAEEAAPGVGVDVFDLATLARRDHWAIPGDATSIAVTPDGEWVLVASTEMPEGRTTITVVDPVTGQTRAIIGGFAGEMVQFVTPSTRL